jgi:formylglycine-generating enzyme required for sulfatase activity
MFVRRLNDKLGPGRADFQLPTEAQWEYACRAGSTTRYCFGDDASRLGEYAWYDRNSNRTTQPVGLKRPNAWGLYDMHGTVREWCQDWYGENYYAESPADDPAGPSEGVVHVLRGTGFPSAAKFCASASRNDGSTRQSIMGFRVARVVGMALAGPKPIINSIGMKLTSVPLAYSTMMGSRESAEDTAAFFNRIYGEDELKTDVFNDEHPQHLVRLKSLTRDSFYLGTYHVTRGQFRQFVEDSGYKTTAERAEKRGAWCWDSESKSLQFSAQRSWRNVGFEQIDEHPVVCVSWDDAMAFCQWLSRKEGCTYRLPTEAEWEYACRAGTTTRYFSGDDPESLAAVGNVADGAFKTRFPDARHTIRASDGYVFTAPVGSYPPNAFGLYDMHGNAWQWCSDWYDERYYEVTSDSGPTGPDAGFARVIRGGSWSNKPHFIRCAQRARNAPYQRDNITGFRVARDH